MLWIPAEPGGLSPAGAGYGHRGSNLSLAKAEQSPLLPFSLRISTDMWLMKRVEAGGGSLVPAVLFGSGFSMDI